MPAVPFYEGYLARKHRGTHYDNAPQLYQSYQPYPPPSLHHPSSQYISYPPPTINMDPALFLPQHQPQYEQIYASMLPTAPRRSVTDPFAYAYSQKQSPCLVPLVPVYSNHHHHHHNPAHPLTFHSQSTNYHSQPASFIPPNNSRPQYDNTHKIKPSHPAPATAACDLVPILPHIQPLQNKQDAITDSQPLKSGLDLLCALIEITDPVEVAAAQAPAKTPSQLLKPPFLSISTTVSSPVVSTNVANAQTPTQPSRNRALRGRFARDQQTKLLTPPPSSCPKYSQVSRISRNLTFISDVPVSPRGARSPSRQISSIPKALESVNPTIKCYRADSARALSSSAPCSPSSSSSSTSEFSVADDTNPPPDPMDFFPGAMSLGDRIKVRFPFPIPTSKAPPTPSA